MASDTPLSGSVAQSIALTPQLAMFAIVGGWATIAVALGFAYGANVLGSLYYPALAVSAAIAAVCDLQVIAIVRELGRLRRERAGSARETIGLRVQHQPPRES